MVRAGWHRRLSKVPLLELPCLAGPLAGRRGQLLVVAACWMKETHWELILLHPSRGSVPQDLPVCCTLQSDAAHF